MLTTRLTLALAVAVMLTLIAPAFSVAQETPELRLIPEPRLHELEAAVQEQFRSFGELIESFSDTEASAPERAGAFGAGGQLYLAYDLPESAEACFENAKTLAPDDFRWPYYLAATYQNLGQLDQAAEAYRDALGLEPDYVPALFHLGEVLWQLNRLDEAETLLRRALELDSSSAAVRAGLGQVAFLRRDFPRAIELFRTALAAVPEANRLHYLLAMALRQQGEHDEARHHLAQSGPVGVRVMDPLIDDLIELRRGERVHTLRGRLAFRLGRYEDAAAAFHQAVEAAPESFRARVNLGSALAALGKADLAIEQYEQALRIDPRSANAHYNLGYLLLRRGDLKGAASHYLSAVEIDPTDYEAHLELAEIRYRENHLAEARRLYAQAKELAPGNARPLLGRARIFAAEGAYREALAELEEAHRSQPSDGGVAQALARLLASSPDPSIRDGARALDLARRVFDASPSAFHAETVALAFAELGQCEEAAEWQRGGVELAKQESRADLVGRMSQDLVRYESESGPPCAAPAREP